MLEESRCDTETSIRCQYAKSHDIDTDDILRDRFQSAANGADSDIVEETELADFNGIRIKNVFVEAFRVLHWEQDAVQLSKLTEIVWSELSNVDPLGKK